MFNKQVRKNIRYFFGWLGFKLCSLIIRLLPRRFIYPFAKLIGRLGFCFAVKHRKLALESLTIAFGEHLSFKECKDIARKNFINMALCGIETIFFINKPHLIKEYVELVNKEILDKALSEGRGVILVSAHFGNFALLMTRLSLEGYKIAGIMRYMRDKRIEKIFLKKRTELGIKTIYSQPRKICVEQTIRALRNNEIVFIPLDQNFGTGGIFVNFFNRKAATATGPVIFAQRTNARIIPCFIIRKKEDRHQIIFEPPIELEEACSQEEKIVKNIQKITNIIEDYIRKYPQEWSWIHRRWKTQPS